MDIEVDNIVLFVADAVRYEQVHSELAELGKTYKTVAASLHTPASFGSLLTGLHVPAHGVTGFHTQLASEIPSILDLESHTTAFSDRTGSMHEDMHAIFGHEERSSLSEIQEPFIWVCRHPAGHAPYNNYNFDTYDLNESAISYFNRTIGESDRMQNEYRKGVEESLDRFSALIEILEERGIRDNTLIIYTSDHGELLGEYGLVGHNHIACPELVYVPTTFVHPDIEPGLQEKQFNHVDMVPTIYDFLSIDNMANSLHGESLRSDTSSIGYNHFEMTFYNSSFLKQVSHVVKSCWDCEGGHAFVENSLLDSLFLYAGLLFFSHKGKQIRNDKTYLSSLSHFLPGHHKYGTPELSIEAARYQIDSVQDSEIDITHRNFDEGTKDRLEDLGYL